MPEETKKQLRECLAVVSKALEDQDQVVNTLRDLLATTNEYLQTRSDELVIVEQERDDRVPAESVQNLLNEAMSQVNFLVTAIELVALCPYNEGIPQTLAQSILEANPMSFTGTDVCTTLES